MSERRDGSGKLDVLSRRADVLRRLGETPAHKRDLADELDQSRRTIDRAINELATHDLVERGDDGFAATTVGRLALDRWEAVQREFDDLEGARDVLAPLSADAALDPAVVAGSEPLLADEPVPHRPLERLHDAIAAGDRYRALLPALDDPRHVRLLYEHVVTDERPAELVVSAALLDALRAEFPRRTAALAEADAFDAFVGDPPPYALVLVTGGPDGDGTTVYLVVFVENASGVHGVLVNDAPAAVRWAEERYDAVRSEAVERTDALCPDTDGGRAVDPNADGGVPIVGRDLSVALEREGFVRLDVSYFREEPVADPVTAWRTGLSIPEVHTGYAVERTPSAEGESQSEGQGSPENGDERPFDGGDSRFDGAPVDGDGAVAGDRALADDLVDRLSAADDCAVVGPPGSGKSTVCKRVACEWYDADRGPVLYREGGRGQPFASVGDLVATVEAADGHALVVVEDAVRPATAAVFDVIERLADRDDASVLLDAREGEWRDAPLDRPDLPALEVVHMPPLSDRDTERVVDHFERTVGRSVDVPVERLRAEATSDDESAPGEVLLLLHRLATYADPLSDERTSLEAAVAAASDDLAGDDRALDVAVLANALNAAGMEVDAGALFALADPGEWDAVEGAIERLEDTVLFRRSDGTYRTVHESWSVAFLAHLVEAAGESAVDRFGDCLTAYLSLADDPERRARIGRRLDYPASTDAVVADPGGWADDVAETLFALGREQPKLAPLFGDGENDAVVLPEACSAAVREEYPVWLGRLFEAGGYYDRAERAYRRLPGPAGDRMGAGDRTGAGDRAGAGDRRGAGDRAGAGDRTGAADGDGTPSDAVVERMLGLASVAHARGKYDAAAATARECRSMLDEDHTLETARAELAVGEALTTRGKHRDAIPHLEAAREGFEATGDRRRLADALSSLGSAAFREGDYDRAREYYARSLDVSRAVGDRRREATSHDRLGTVAFARGDYERARSAFERCLDVVRGVGDRHTTVETLNSLGVVVAVQAAYDESLAYYREALDVARRIGDRDLEAQVLGNTGLLYERRGDYDGALDALERSLETNRDIGDSFGEAVRLTNLGLVRVRRGDQERAREQFATALDVVRDHEAPRHEVSALNGLSHVARTRGRFERARDRAEAALSLAREIDLTRREADSLNKLGLTARRRADLERARDYHETALGVARDIDHSREEAKALAGLAAVARRQDDLSLARERVDEALSVIESTGNRIETAQIRLVAGRIALDGDDFGTARDRAERVHETFDAMDATLWVGRALRLRGRVAAASGDPDVARDRWRTALDALADVEAPHDELATLELLVGLDQVPADGDPDVEDAAGGDPDGEDGDDEDATAGDTAVGEATTGDATAGDATTAWCRQAVEALADAPDSVADRHREWVARRAEAPDVSSASGDE